MHQLQDTNAEDSFDQRLWCGGTDYLDRLEIEITHNWEYVYSYWLISTISRKGRRDQLKVNKKL